MADVKWFKVLTDMFSDDKIKIIQSMPEGDSLLVMWFKVLAQAGKTNDGGYIYLKKNMPYTAGMLSTLFNKPQQTVELALRTFSEFEMIDIDQNGYIFVTNWEKHQSIEKMDKIKEQTRLRVAEHRKKKKLELEEASGVTNHVTESVTSNVTVTQGNATDIEVDKELEKDISTTTTTTTTDDFSVMGTYTKVFGGLVMNGLFQDFIMRIKQNGYTDTFITELMLETGESSSQPNLKLMQAIAERWIKDGIYSRQQSKEQKERRVNNAESQRRFEKGIQPGRTSGESEYAFLDQQNRPGA